jgi:hypothetical protein
MRGEGRHTGPLIVVVIVVIGPPVAAPTSIGGEGQPSALPLWTAATARWSGSPHTYVVVSQLTREPGGVRIISS